MRTPWRTIWQRFDRIDRVFTVAAIVFLIWAFGSGIYFLANDNDFGVLSLAGGLLCGVPFGRFLLFMRGEDQWRADLYRDHEEKMADIRRSFPLSTDRP